MGLRKVTYSVAVQYAGRVAGLLCSLGTAAILTRYLGVSGYGEYVTVMAIASLIISFSDFGFFWSTIHNLGINDDRAKALRELGGVRFILTTLALIVGGLFVWLSNYSHEVRVAYVILTIFIFSSSLNGVLVATYQSEYKMMRPTLSELAARVVNLILVSTGAYIGASFTYFIVVVSMASTVSFLLNWLGLIQQYGKIKPQFFGFSWIKYSRSVFLLGIIQVIYISFYRIDVVFLSWFKPAVDVGIYGIATKVSELVSTGSSLFVGSLFPLLVSSYRRNQEAFMLYVKKSLGTLLLIALPIGILGQFFTTDVVRIIGGKEFLTASSVVFFGKSITASQVLSLILLFNLLNYCSVVFYTALLAANQLRALIKINIFALTVNVVLNVILIPRFSYLATTMVTVITELVVLLSTWWYFWRQFSNQFPWGWTARVFVAIIPSLIFLSVAPGLGLFIRFLLASLLYLIALRFIAWPTEIILWKKAKKASW